ncbi:MAG: glycosyltransferase [Patescibacteria group bacterium]|nr:glycosyltransferase [Patescibacteria group bacterium]MCL5095309.1 glycosyltransferase [Patescibacteria group bacterium]
MKISFITTVLNEEKTIDLLFNSLLLQTEKPEEVVIVDGGSKDRTLQILEKRNWKLAKQGIKVLIIVKKGNRAVGRNEAVRQATGEVIALTDAGCELDRNFLKQITGPFGNPKVEVVAGYYKAKTKTIFEKCVVPFVLVMPDKLKPESFLPSSRSMAIKRNLFLKLGGFPEECSDNEDYVFAQRLVKKGIKIHFAKNALVYWLPRTNLFSFFLMIYRFARGDAQARLRRKKVLTVYLRYLLGLIFLVLYFLPFKKPIRLDLIFLFLIFAYFLWSIKKNYRYVKHWLAFLYLPLLQITADLGVMTGSLRGFFKKRVKLS